MRLTRKNTLKVALVRYILRILLRCHNFLYRQITRLSLIIEPGGLNPKHRVIDYHQWFIDQIKPEWSILDVGCGVGALACDLAKHCKQIIGIDIAPQNIEEAKKRARGEFICGDVTTYPFNQTFDAIILSNVLEHIENRIAFLKKISRFSKRLFFRVPMIDRDWITLYKRELGVEYRLDPTHFIEYTLEEFIKELKEAGIEIESYRVRYGEIYAVAVVPEKLPRER